MKKKFTLLLAAVMLLMMMSLPGNAVGQTVAVNDLLWKEVFKGTNTSSFSPTTSWTNYVNPTTFVSDDASSLVYSSANTMMSSSSAGNMNGAHAWINQKTTGYFQVVGIKLYNTTKVKVSWAQAGNTKVTVAYAFDGGNTYTDLSYNASATTEYLSSELNVEGHTTINLKFYRTSTSTNLRIDNLTLKATAVASSGPGINVDAALAVSPKAVTDAELEVEYNSLGTLINGSVTLYDGNDQVIHPSWFSADFNDDYSKVIYTTTNNTLGAENSLRMHLAVSDGTNNVTADVAVTQDFILTTMDQIFARATANGSTAKEVTINFYNWVITGHNGGNSYSTAKKAWLTDGTKGCVVYGESPNYPGFQANEKLNGIITCNLKLNTSYAQITGVKKGMAGLDTTNDGVVTPVTNKTIAELSEINTGSVVTLTNLTYDSSTSSLTDENNNTIRPYNHIFSLMSFTDGKTYNVTGVFETYSSTPAKKIYPRSDTDIAEVVPEDPTIYVNPTTLSDFSYIIGDGPSAAQTVNIEGINLTHDITIAFSGTDASAFEMSLSQNGSYANTITLTHSEGTVSETPVYVRLKEDLAAQNYSATLALSSEDATPQNIALSGSVNNLSFTWNLATNSYSSASTTLVQWTSDYAIMKNEKNTSSTNANNYIPPTNTSTRFYSGQKLSLIPAENYAIVNAVFTAASSGYANAFANSSWTNATATASTASTPYTVTVTPTDGSTTISAIIGGTCGFNSVTVYYKELVSYAITIDNTIEHGSVSVVGDLTQAHENATISLAATPDDDDYVFQSWNVYKTGDSQTTIYVENNQFTMPAYPVTISASFRAKETYTVSYSVNGLVQSTESVTEGDEITLPASPSGIPSGYTFMGWRTSTLPVTNTAPTDYATDGTCTADMTYYAVMAAAGTSTPTTVTLNATGLTINGQYHTGTKNDNEGNTWSYYATINNDSQTMCFGLNKNANNYNIGSPTFSGNITAISMKVKNDSGTARTVYICSSNATAQPSSGDIASLSVPGNSPYNTERSINLSSSPTFSQFYVYVSAALKFSEIKVTYNKPTYSNYCTTINTFSTAGNWNVGSNWSWGNVPTTEPSVNIGAECTIPNGTVANVNNIIMSDGGSITIEDGGQLITKNAVQATVKKTVASHNGSANAGWTFIAMPITNSGVAPGEVSNMINVDAKKYDLYRFNEGANPGWENYKQEGDHQHFNLEHGRGYLYANQDGAALSFAGTVNPGTSPAYNTYTVNLDFTSAENGWNLVGNPFTCNATVSRPCYVISGNSVVSTEATTIAPGKGVMVRATDEDRTVTFTKTTDPAAMSNGHNAIELTLAQNVTTRGESSSQTLDNAIVSFNEGSQLGKFYFGTQDANLYIPMDNEEYAIVSSSAQGEMPINFKAHRDGQYTITVNPQEVEMGYLHLIDNIAGVEVDLLANPSYTFNARYDDYESRFRLVFSANMVNADLNDDFAFFSNGQLVVANEGEAILQVIDVNGRIVATESINGTCSKAISARAGVYVLRLINGTDVKTQKIIVE